MKTNIENNGSNGNNGSNDPSLGLELPLSYRIERLQRKLYTQSRFMGLESEPGASCSKPNEGDGFRFEEP